MKGFKINFDWLPIFDGEFASFDETEDAYNSIMAIFCVICAGLAAGLTMYVRPVFDGLNYLIIYEYLYILGEW